MEYTLEALIGSYLENVNEVLAIFRSKAGPVLPGKSWRANIPDQGHYTDAGISAFERHGAGIWVRYKDRFIDFDFCDLNLPEAADTQKFITIDAGFLMVFIESTGMQEQRWASYNLLQEALQALEKQGVLVNIEHKYYLREDINTIIQAT